MNKQLKRGGVALVLLLLTVVVGGAIFLLNFDPKVYQDRLVKEIKLRYERDLKINGDIDLSLFPRIGLRVTDVTLSNKNSEEEFSSMKEVRFAVALWPLLFDRFLVDHVKVTGFKTHIVRYADGSLNIDDFYALPLDFDEEHMAHRRQQAEATEVTEPSSRMAANEFKIDIAGLDLEDGSVLFEDQGTGRQFSFDDMSIYTGRITFGEAFSLALNAKVDARHPSDDANLNVRGMMRLDPAGFIYQAERLNATLQGQIKGYKIEDASLSGNFTLDDFAGYANGTAVKFLLNLSALEGDSRLSQIKLDAQADEVGLNRIETQLLAKNLEFKGSTADAHKRSLAWQLNSPNLNFYGFDAAGDPLTGTIEFRGEESMDLNVSLDGFSGLASSLEVRENKIQGQYLTSASRAIDIDFSSPLTINLLSGEFNYPALSGLVRLSDGDVSQEVPVTASISGDVRNSTMEFNVDAMMDTERMSLIGSLESFSKPQIDFKLNAASLALDHILGVDTSLPLTALMFDTDKHEDSSSDVVATETQAEIETSPASATATEEGTQVVSAETNKEVKAPESLQVEPQSLSLKRELLSRLSGVGVFSIDKMSYRDLQFNNLGATLFFGSSNDIKIDSLRADLFGGELYANSDMSLVDGRVSLDLTLNDVNMQELLQRFKGRVLLNGKADIGLDLTSQGLSEKELLQNLRGELKLDATDGVLHGFSIDHVLDDINYIVDTGGQQLYFDKNEQTAFERFNFNAAVDDGIVNFESLALEGEAFSLLNKDQNSSYNMLNGDFDLSLQFTAKRPVSVQRQGVRVQVKSLSIPLQLWNERDSIQIKTEIQGLH